MSIVVALFALSFLIFIHELGHYAIARYFGVKVEVFSIGFGKALWSKYIGDTRWQISAIPLGGYVQMKGQVPTKSTSCNADNDSYTSMPPAKKIAILLAGPLANFAVAFVLYWVSALYGIAKLEPVIGKIDRSMPAYQAGLLPGDRILSIGGVKIKYWEDVGREIKKYTLDSLEIVVKRENEVYSYRVVPKKIQQKTIFGEQKEHFVVGILPKQEVVIVKYDPIEAIGFALDQTVRAIKLIFLSIYKLVQGVVGIDQISGVVSIVDMTAEVAKTGVVAFMMLTALISVNLGVLNLLPIPALDGGHILFNLYEMLFKQKPNEKMLVALTLGGWIFLIGIMTIGILNDFRRLGVLG